MPSAHTDAPVQARIWAVWPSPSRWTPRSASAARMAATPASGTLRKAMFWSRVKVRWPSA